MVTARQFRRSLEMRGTLLQGRNEVRMPCHSYHIHQRPVRRCCSCIQFEGITITILRSTINYFSNFRGIR